jgi:hypothetical protein
MGIPIHVITIMKTRESETSIEAILNEGSQKWKSTFYLVKDGEDNKALISSDEIYDTEQEAIEWMDSVVIMGKASDLG